MRELNILIVDDDKDLADSLAEFLALDDHHVDIAVTGKTGIEAACENDYDLVLMDIMLPDINGVDCMRTIWKAKPAAWVQLISGFSANFLDSTAVEAETLDVLPKPVDLNALSRRLAAIDDNGTTNSNR